MTDSNHPDPGTTPKGDASDADAATPEAKAPTLDELLIASKGATYAKVKGAEDGSDSPPGILASLRAVEWQRSGLMLFLLGGFAAFLLMAYRGQLRIFGVPLGLVAVMVSAFGALDALGTFNKAKHLDGDVQAKEPKVSIEGDTLLIPFLRTFGSFVLFAALIGLAGRGYKAHWIGWAFGAFIYLAFLNFLVSIVALGQDAGLVSGRASGFLRGVHQRYGFWVLALGGFLYLPSMGVFSLWDPWETHYGEVAREILARNDWVSLWWAQDGWFWSKPILNFWVQALAMASLGTGYMPDQMLLSGAGAGHAHPEWVVRAPNVLMTLAAMYAIYKGVAKVFGKRAGFLGGVVLATMPDWYFLAHQTMADMSCVSAMTAAMGLLLLGLNTDESEQVKSSPLKFGGRVFHVSGFHFAMGLIVVFALPQILYLLSRNIELNLGRGAGWGFRIHWDEFQFGSAQNCGLQGNEGCRLTLPALLPKGQPSTVTRLFGGFEPILQGLMWLVILGAILVTNIGERRVRRLCYHGAWLAAAVATMGKGPMGFVIPMICAFAYLATKRRWEEIGKLEIWSGVLIIGAVALPWFLAMYVRHGPPFIDRLIFHDMVNRTFSHVHDTNEGTDTSFRFYLWQLGYALFPWTGLAPLGLVYWLRRGDSAGKGQSDASVFLAMWFGFGFFLFSFMGTKFHHYIFPVLPPIAMMIGVALDGMLPAWVRTKVPANSAYRTAVDSAAESDGKDNTETKDTTVRTIGARIGYGAVMLISALCIVYGVSRFFPGSVLGTKISATELHKPMRIVGGLLIAVGLAIAFIAAPYFSKSVTEVESEGGLAEDASTAGSEGEHQSRMFAAAAIAGAIGLGLVVADLIDAPDGTTQPGPIRFLQLFTYQYTRPWPMETIDFMGVMKAIGGVAVVLMFGLGIRKIRAHAVHLFVAFACVAATWGMHVYMVKIAPHWGQREVIEAYYRDRHGAEEEIVAYQMNWKGENFYTGNRIPAFVSSGSTFTAFVKQKKDKGAKFMYFVTEHSRVGGLKSEAGAKTYTELTTKADCNKFVLVKAEL
jgi:4-amino-4-deoxy-L-arabinose transferase-like glycosyltransferase